MSPKVRDAASWKTENSLLPVIPFNRKSEASDSSITAINCGIGEISARKCLSACSAWDRYSEVYLVKERENPEIPVKVLIKSSL